MIELVIFDFDGVLVDSEYLVAQVRVELLANYNIHTDVQSVLRKYIGLHGDVVNDLIGQQIGTDNLTGYIAEYDAAIDVAVKSRLNKIVGVDAALEQIKQPICIGSNSDFVPLCLKIQVTGLERFFSPDVLFVGAMVPKPKPAPDLYLLAANHYNVKPENCLVVEDSVPGIKAAIAANMHVVGFYGASHCYDGYEQNLIKAGATTVFNDMDELSSMIAKF